MCDYTENGQAGVEPGTCWAGLALLPSTERNSVSVAVSSLLTMAMCGAGPFLVEP